MTNRFQPAFEAQREQFPSDATKTLEWRIDQLDRMERMRTDNKDAWCAALYQDFGKPPFEQLFEITVPTGVIKFYRDNLEALMTPQPVAILQGLESTGNRGVIYKEPYGVTLVIGPFNAPILLLLDPAIAALAAGNPVILKPANTTPATAALFNNLVSQYFALENVTVVTGGREEIGALLESAAVLLSATLAFGRPGESGHLCRTQCQAWGALAPSRARSSRDHSRLRPLPAPQSPARPADDRRISKLSQRW